MKLSYAITVCNEFSEIRKLITLLAGIIREEDEIVVLHDVGAPIDKEMLFDRIPVYDFCMAELKASRINIYQPAFLNRDFASFKNQLFSICTGDYIFQIDADELPSTTLISDLPEILKSNSVDLINIPRVNTVIGLTNKHVKKWNWRVDEIIKEEEMDTESEKYKFLKQNNLIIDEYII